MDDPLIKQINDLEVDRTARVLVSGEPVPEDQNHTELRANGQQKDYVVLTASERSKGFARPYRDAYRHVGAPGPKFELCDLTEEQNRRFGDYGYVKFEVYPEGYKGSSTGRFWTQEQLDKKGCGKITTMGRAIAETYARDPKFYSGTFCTSCHAHFPVGEDGEFVWYEMDGSTGPRWVPSVIIQELIDQLQKLEWKDREVCMSHDAVTANSVCAIGEPEEQPQIVILFSERAFEKIKSEVSASRELQTEVPQ